MAQREGKQSADFATRQSEDVADESSLRIAESGIRWGMDLRAERLALLGGCGVLIL
jgi:hypothetical protein